MPKPANPALNTLLRTRRSIRQFTGAAIPAELVRELIETAAHAPSAHGLQPWRFAIIESQTAREALGQALTNQIRLDMRAQKAPESEIETRVQRSLRRMVTAPVIVLLCRDTSAVRARAPEEDLMGIQSVAMAGLQFMLAAHAHGLGANWICWPLYAQAATVRALGLPDTWEPQGMIFLGHPAEEPGEKRLKTPCELIQNL
jgi:F420 biosynthesis protein FbiB-like protein